MEDELMEDELMEDELMEDELVVLELFSDESEAHIAQGFLESCGIPAYVFSGGLHLRRYTIGSDIEGRARTKLMVNSSDLKEARELLAKKEIL